MLPRQARSKSKLEWLFFQARNSPACPTQEEALVMPNGEGLMTNRHVADAREGIGQDNL